MKKAIVIALLTIVSLSMHAQQNNDSFRAYLFNKEYEVYMRINFYDQNIRAKSETLSAGSSHRAK